jgi:hypothetical protein
MDILVILLIVVLVLLLLGYGGRRYGRRSRL